MEMDSGIAKALPDRFLEVAGSPRIFPDLAEQDARLVVQDRLRRIRGERLLVLAIVTKSGTNEVHGTASEFLRSDDLDSSEFFANRSGKPQPEFRQNQFGATVGGPIVRNRTFLFFMYEGQRRSRESTLLNVVRTTEMFGGDLSQDTQGRPPRSSTRSARSRTRTARFPASQCRTAGFLRA